VEINGFLRPLPVAAKDKIIVFAHVQNGLMNHVSDGDVAMAEDSDDDAPMARDPLISPPIRLRLKEKKRSIRDYKGKPLKIIVTGEPGVGKTTFCNHSRSIMSAKGSHGRYVEYSHTAPGSHSGSVTSLFETYMLGGNERVCLQDGKGLEIGGGDEGLLKLAMEGRMKNSFNMKLGCEGIKDMYFNKGLGKKLTREEENAMSLLRSGDDDDPQLEAYRPNVVFLVIDAAATSESGLENYRKMVEEINKHKVKLCIILNKCDKLIDDPEERKALMNNPMAILNRPKVTEECEKVSEALGVGLLDVYAMISKPMRKELNPDHSLLVIRPFTSVLDDLKCLHEEERVDMDDEMSSGEEDDPESDYDSC